MDSDMLPQTPLPGAPKGRIKADHGMQDECGNHLYPVPRRAGPVRTTECEMYAETTPYPVPRKAGPKRTTVCDMFPATTFTRCPAGPGQGGPRNSRCIREPPLPGAPRGRTKGDRGVRHVSGHHLYPVHGMAG